MAELKPIKPKSLDFPSLQRKIKKIIYCYYILIGQFTTERIDFLIAPYKRKIKIKGNNGKTKNNMRTEFS